MKTPDTITKAKTALILDQPFFASLLLSMPIVENPQAKTIQTDGVSIEYNPEFMAEQSLPETVFLFGHETMHCVFEHMYTRGNRDPKRWNRACDYIINDILTRERIGIMPDGGLLDSELVKRGGGTAQGVYELLKQQDEQNKADGKGDGSGPGPGEPGGSLDECLDAKGDQAERSAKESEMRVKIIQAANAAKMCGKLSAGLERLVKTLTATRTDWKAILRRFFSERAKQDYTFARPKRRFLADDIYLPSLSGIQLGEIVIAIDCSGSINENILAYFGGHLSAIIEDVKPSLIRVIYFDSKVLKCDTLEPETALKLECIGGGGTAFEPIFKYIENENFNPMACVILTDLQCDNFGPAVEYPVLWASIDQGKAPFGETVLINNE